MDKEPRYETLYLEILERALNESKKDLSKKYRIH